MHPETRRRAASPTATGCACSTTAAATTLEARVNGKPRRGVVVAPSVWWKKYAPDGRNANNVTSQRTADLGGGATFYDCRVQVEKSVSKADELRLLHDAIKTFPDAVAIRAADGRLIACSDLYARLATAADTPENGEFQAADGRWLRRSVRPLAGGGSVELVADVTELRRAEQAARFLDSHDATLPLQGIPMACLYAYRTV